MSAWAKIMASKAMLEQLAIVSKSRLFSRTSMVSHKDMERIEAAIKIQLDLP